MKTKKCIRCNVEKVVSDYYKHGQMADGHLNKCKECCKTQAAERHHLLYKDESFIESERQRGREKYQRLNYKEKYRNITDDKPWMKTQVYKNLHRNKKCEKGYELHHWNYNFLNDVIVISISDHRKIHKKMKLDKEKKIFIYNDKYLDTLEKHKNAIEKILSDVYRRG